MGIVAWRRIADVSVACRSCSLTASVIRNRSFPCSTKLAGLVMFAELPDPFAFAAAAIVLG